MVGLTQYRIDSPSIELLNKRSKMKIPVRYFLGLITMGVIVPGLVLLAWSSGKTQSSTAAVGKLDLDPSEAMAAMLRSPWYESQENIDADIFMEPQQTEKPRRAKSSGPLTEQTTKPQPKEIFRPLVRNPSSLAHRETPKPLPKEPPRQAPRATLKLSRKELPNAPNRPQIVVRNPKQSDKDNSFQQSSNGNPRNAWKESDQQSRKQGMAETWKGHLRKACAKLHMGGTPESLAPDMLRKIIVDDKHKLLYCQIPKVASTTWRRVFLQLSGRLNNTNILAISANDVHHKYDGLIKYLGDYSQEEISQRLKDYFKFVFVREPFERVLSAYKNKFLTQTPSATYFKWKFGRKIISKYRNQTVIPIPANNTGQNVLFEEFVNYLIDDGRRIMMNEHWELYHRLCFPCQIDYDFVGHLERIDEDSQFILDSNHLSDEIKVPSREGSRYTLQKTNSLMEDFYSKLDPSTISRLYQMYKADFDIFNYTIPAEISALMSPSPIV